jgi:hypothetical protein
MKITIVVFGFSLLFIACASQSARERLRAGAELRKELFEQTSQDSQKLAASETNERIVISSATIKMELSEPDSAQNQLMLIAQKYRGYVLSSEKSKTIIRVLSAQFRDAILEIEQLGKVKNKNVSGEDVTEEFRDLEIRLDSAEKTRKRYLELLNKADKVDEILKIEKELERLYGEIDLLQGKIKRLSHLTQYATITVEAGKGVKKGVLGYVFYAAYTGVKWLFVR